MADEIPGVKNMFTSCKVSNDELILEYKVVNGKVEKSFGIEVAKMIKFPEKVIKDAENYLALYEMAHARQKDGNNPENSKLSKEYKSSTKERVRFLYHEMSRKISKDKSSEEVTQIKR